MASGNFPSVSPAIVLLSGLPGADKTTFAQLLAAHGFAHVESDAIRRSLHARPEYTSRESARVFAIAERRAREALAREGRVIVDATNLTRNDRRRFLRLAREAGAILVAVRLVAPDEVVRQRLRVPREGHSQADERVYELMRPRPQPFACPVVVADSRYDLAPTVALVLRMVEEAPGVID